MVLTFVRYAILMREAGRWALFREFNGIDTKICRAPYLQGIFFENFGKAPRLLRQETD